MSIPGSVNPLFLGASAAESGYQISRSLRSNSADSTYLSRTPDSAGNRKTWTWAGWTKRSSVSSAGYLFTGGLVTNDAAGLFYDSSQRLRLRKWISGSGSDVKTSTNVFRDPSAWNHIVCSVDTTNATPEDRQKFYVNGERITAWDVDAPFSQDEDTGVNATELHAIGATTNPSVYFDGYLADIHFIDGQALDPTSFGEFDDNGIWQPIRYAGTYGTNGFHLDFRDNSAATAAALGKDSSGNGNNWTPNNLSVAAGAGNDSLVDVPTNGTQTDTGVGGQVRGNYCTWNPLDTQGTTLSNGNLDALSTAAGISKGTIAVNSGKWYWEVTKNASNTSIGIAPVTLPPSTSYLGNGESWSYYSVNGQIYTNGSGTAYGNSYANGDIIGVALDLDAGTLVFYKNGVSQGTAVTGLTGTYVAGTSNDQNGPSVSANFGQRPFAYTAPSGFKALCTANLPAPTIEDGSTVMDVVTWIGDGTSSRNITLPIAGDLVWAKKRSAIGSHQIADTVRGDNKVLLVNSSIDERDPATEFGGGGIVSISGTTVTIDQGTSNNDNLNLLNGTHVAWTWDAGSSTVTNNDGSISSQVRANPSAGFSIVTYTSNGLNGISVGHGLGVKPALVIQKDRTAASDWLVLTQLIDGSNDYLLLNSSAAAAAAAAGMTSTTFGSWDRTNGNSMVAYCFAPVESYSSFGRYTGNANTDGPFVYTGFRPAFLLIKRTNDTGNWLLYDNKRGEYNLNGPWIYVNRDEAEGTSSSSGYDFLSNGFKTRNTYTDGNLNGSTYVYAAFAENPFALNARAR